MLRVDGTHINLLAFPTFRHPEEAPSQLERCFLSRRRRAEPAQRARPDHAVQPAQEERAHPLQRNHHKQGECICHVTSFVKDLSFTTSNIQGMPGYALQNHRGRLFKEAIMNEIHVFGTILH